VRPQIQHYFGSVASSLRHTESASAWIERVRRGAGSGGAAREGAEVAAGGAAGGRADGGTRGAASGGVGAAADGAAGAAAGGAEGSPSAGSHPPLIQGNNNHNYWHSRRHRHIQE